MAITWKNVSGPSFNPNAAMAGANVAFNRGMNSGLEGANAFANRLEGQRQDLLGQKLQEMAGMENLDHNARQQLFSNIQDPRIAADLLKQFQGAQSHRLGAEETRLGNQNQAFINKKQPEQWNLDADQTRAETLLRKSQSKYQNAAANQVGAETEKFKYNFDNEKQLGEGNKLINHEYNRLGNEFLQEELANIRPDDPAGMAIARENAQARLGEAVNNGYFNDFSQDKGIDLGILSDSGNIVGQQVNKAIETQAKMTEERNKSDIAQREQERNAVWKVANGEEVLGVGPDGKPTMLTEDQIKSQKMTASQFKANLYTVGMGPQGNPGPLADYNSLDKKDQHKIDQIFNLFKGNAASAKYILENNIDGGKVDLDGALKQAANFVNKGQTFAQQQLDNNYQNQSLKGNAKANEGVKKSKEELAAENMAKTQKDSSLEKDINDKIRQIQSGNLPVGRVASKGGGSKSKMIQQIQKLIYQVSDPQLKLMLESELSKVR